MLPLAKSNSGTLKEGFIAFIKRRSARILPPYYAAIIFSLIFIAMFPSLRYASSLHWNYPLKAFEPGILISHLLLIHNLSPYWIFRIDLPLWNLATEWQMYFIFPLLLLPIYRRCGIYVTIAVGFVVGLAPHFLAPKSINLDPACFWFIGLFAQGMAASVIGFSNDPKLIRIRRSYHWGWISACCWFGMLAIGLMSRYGLPKELRWISDPIVGLGAATLMIYCTRFLTGMTEGKKPFILSLFMSKPAIAIGKFSYSLYLIHYPLVALSFIIMTSLHLSPIMQLLICFFVIVPIIISISYLFYLVFERPCIDYSCKLKRNMRELSQKS